MIFVGHLVRIFLLICLLTFEVWGQITSEPFEFQFEGKTLRGLIEKPETHIPEALIIIIPGYGKTNFVEGNWYGELRMQLVGAGLAVCFWDKMGCGKSEGQFDAQQPVENSADEAIAAIEQIKIQKVPGAESIGLWGISRAGWISPLINQKYPIDFWISVSGTDDKENFGYLVRSNLLIHGKSDVEATRLFEAWISGHQLFCTGGTYAAYLDAIKPLMEDSLSRSLFGYSKTSELSEEGQKAFIKEQKLYTQNGYFDTKSGLWVYLDKFDEILSEMNCPVLALFGSGDSQVDWRKTKQLYEETIGKNSRADLTIEVFDNCNHNLQKCVSCGYQENLSSLGWQACDGYYEMMKEWLLQNVTDK